MMHAAPLKWIVAIVLLSAACGGGAPLYGPPTESVCATDSTLTYESFGKPFMDEYCIRCHASTLHGADRNGAPAFHDFDTLPGIKNVANHIDETTAAGPASVNLGMPNSGKIPSEAERKLLGEWIACGTPAGG